MQKLFLFCTLLISFHVLHAQYSTCNGKSYAAPVFSDSALLKLNANLQTAKKNYETDSSNADHIIWYGRRLAYLARYDEAITIFSKGITLHPTDARMYRHRGHRYLTTRCYDKAIADFEKAGELIKGKKDEMEPDGIPNAKNTPTSSLQSNIWYHLGLAYYLKKDYAKAEEAYKKCMKVSNNPDMYVATANWYYITLWKLDKVAKANALLKKIHKKTKLIENTDYQTILLIYKGEQNPAEIRTKFLDDTSPLSNATIGFGLGNYYLSIGHAAEGVDLLRRVTEGPQWASFGYMAAEAMLGELKRPHFSF
jgi:tetratricopeptide (TPR) repeat protein